MFSKTIQLVLSLLLWAGFHTSTIFAEDMLQRMEREESFGTPSESRPSAEQREEEEGSWGCGS